MSDDLPRDAPRGGLFAVLDRIAGLLLLLSIVMILLMTVHIVADTIIRGVTKLAVEGTIEIASNYYMVALIFLPLAYIQRRRGHLAAEIFTQWLGTGAQRVLDAIADILMAAFLGVLVYQTCDVALTATADREFVELTESSIPIWPTKWLVPIGFGFMALSALFQAAGLIAGAGRRGPHREGPPPSAGSSLT